MQTIFLTASLPMTIRNLLRTGVLDSLSLEYNIVLLTPFAEQVSFVEEFDQKNIVLKNLPIQESPWLRKVLSLYARAARRRFLRTFNLDSFFFAEQFNRQTRPGNYLFNSLIELMNQKQLLERLLKHWYISAWSRSIAYNQLFEEYEPVAVVSTHPYISLEWPLVGLAQRKGIFTIAMIHSWDNITMRGELPFHFDKVIVWSHSMKKDALKYHHWLLEEDVIVSGSSQFDLFLDKNLIIPRDDFIKQLGLDPQRALITFAGGGEQYSAEPEVINFILSAIERDKLTKPSQLWVRFYGGEHFKVTLPLMINRNYVRWEQASSEFWGKYRTERKWEPGIGLQHYINLLYHSDVIICFASTVSIDAAILDRPVINVAYEDRPLDFMHSARRLFWGRDHYQKVVRSGAVRLALDAEELIRYLNEYLVDPGLDHAARQRLVAEICGPMDGRIRERVVTALINSIKNGRGRLPPNPDECVG